MRIAPIVCALVLAVGCSKKKQDAEPPAPPPAAADAAAAAAATDAAAASDAAEAQAPADAATTAAAGKVCCCESMGDAVHDSLEKSEAICTGEGLEGTCVDIKDCEMASVPVVLVADQAVTVPAAGLLAAFAGSDTDAFVPIEIKLSGKNAAIRTVGGGDEWKKVGKVPVDGANPITITAKADGTAVISNGSGAWVVSQEFRYSDAKLKKQ